MRFGRLLVLGFLGIGCDNAPAPELVNPTTYPTVELQPSAPHAARLEKVDVPSRVVPLDDVQIFISAKQLKPEQLSDPLTPFQLATTRELYLYTEVRPVSSSTSERILLVRVLGPSGESYDQFTSLLSFAPMAPVRLQAAGGPPEGLEVLRLRPSARYRAQHVLPVAGAYISQFGIKGKWKVQAFLDAEATPRATASFELQ